MDSVSKLRVGRREKRVMRSMDEKWATVEAAMPPGASNAAVARHHGVNASLVLGWRPLSQQGLAVPIPTPQGANVRLLSLDG